MSEIYNRIHALVYRCANGEISIDDFRAAFADLYFQVRQGARGDVEANALASKIIGPLAELSRGHRDESSFRAGLASAIHVFEEQPAGTPQYLRQ
jgi:hypothetical protein